MSVSTTPSFIPRLLSLILVEPISLLKVDAYSIYFYILADYPQPSEEDVSSDTSNEEASPRSPRTYELQDPVERIEEGAEHINKKQTQITGIIVQ